MPERVVFQTKDQVAVVGSFQVAPGATAAVLMLHMLPADRHSWEEMQTALSDRGISSLAIDLRGHGESTVKNGGRIDYHDFSLADSRESIEDIRSALQWLASRGIPASRVAVMGASIGANLALNIVAERPEIPAVVLLSPGEAFSGITTFDAAKTLGASQALWAVASEGDDQESFNAATQIIQSAASREKMFKSLTASGHGTNVFLQHPELVGEVADWLESRLK